MNHFIKGAALGALALTLLLATTACGKAAGSSSTGGTAAVSSAGTSGAGNATDTSGATGTTSANAAGTASSPSTTSSSGTASSPDTTSSPNTGVTSAVPAAGAEAKQDGQTLSFGLFGNNVNFSCSLTIPKNWNSIYEAEVSTSATGIGFYSKNNRDFGGMVFAIWALTDEEVADPNCFQGCDDDPVLLQKDEKSKVSFYLVYPYTDVEYNNASEPLKKEYQTIMDSASRVCESFTCKPTS